MSQRPYSHLTGSELSRVLSEALEKGRSAGGPIPSGGLPRQYREGSPPPGAIDVTVFGDPHKSYLVPGMGVDVGVGADQTVETIFRVGSDGRPEAITRLVTKPSPGAVRNATETEFNWLRHRVDEVIGWARS